MLSDMPDGSSGDYNEPYDNQEYDETDMSGSGHMCKSVIEFFYVFFCSVSFLYLFNLLIFIA